MTHGPDLRRTARELSDSGWPPSQIALALGVARSTITRWRTRGFKAGQTTRPSVAVPRWVPDALRWEYLARAKAAGEEDAASWARKAKREMEREAAHG